MATIFPTDVPAKANPTTADILLIADVADNDELKKITIGDITTDIGAGLIVDASASTTTTYSSDKINTLNGTQDSTISSNYSTLNTNKLNRAAQLRTGNGAWKTIYNDVSGNEVELALGAANYVLQSNGAAAAPTWVAPAVDINAMTEDTAGNMAADFLLAYDTSAGANKKQKPQVYTASDAEATAGASTTKWMTPKNVKDNYQSITKTYTLVASATVQYNDSTDIGFGAVDNTWVSKKSFTVNTAGTIYASVLFNAVSQQQIRFLHQRAGATIATLSTTSGNGADQTITTAAISVIPNDTIVLQVYRNTSYADGTIKDFWGLGTLTEVNPIS